MNSRNAAVDWGCRVLAEHARAGRDGDGDPFLTVRGRFDGARRLEISELLHGRAAAPDGEEP